MIERLLHLGFTPKEAALYLAALEVGEASPVSTIAKRAGINRTTAYDLLEQLVLRGLILTSDHKGYRSYQALDPSKLVAHLKEESIKYARLSKEAERLLPELQTHYHSRSDRPRVYFYEGVEGLMRVYEETLASKGEILAYACSQENALTIPGYFPRYYKRRTEKNIPIRAIFPDTAEDRKRHAMDGEELRKSVILPQEKFNITPEINIFNDKIMIADWREKLGIIIESKEISNALRQIFELSWQAAEKYQEEKPKPKAKKK